MELAISIYMYISIPYPFPIKLPEKRNPDCKTSRPNQKYNTAGTRQDNPE